MRLRGAFLQQREAGAFGGECAEQVGGWFPFADGGVEQHGFAGESGGAGDGSFDGGAFVGLGGEDQAAAFFGKCAAVFGDDSAAGNGAWRFDSPGEIPLGVSNAFSDLIGRIAAHS